MKPSWLRCHPALRFQEHACLSTALAPCSCTACTSRAARRGRSLLWAKGTRRGKLHTRVAARQCGFLCNQHWLPLRATWLLQEFERAAFPVWPP